MFNEMPSLSQKKKKLHGAKLTAQSNMIPEHLAQNKQIQQTFK
jgi:hypothetical protein